MYIIQCTVYMQDENRAEESIHIKNSHTRTRVNMCVYVCMCVCVFVCVHVCIVFLVLHVQ